MIMHVRSGVIASLALTLCFAAPVLAQTTRAVPALEAKRRINLAWQIALDGVHFSPGILDAAFGRKSQLALKEYAARYFPGSGIYDLKVYESLGVDVAHATECYTITDEDAAQVGLLPDDWNEKAKLERLPYVSLADCLTEKFHCTLALLHTLNPSVNFASLNVGQVLVVPHLALVADPPTQPATRLAPAEYASINLTEKTIRLFDKEDRQLALFHCSVAKDKAKLPARDTVIKKMALNPMYTFDPKNWPDVTNVDHILNIPPGPRNPVGLAWIGLDLPGYGIHGNPKPELIGKTGSHGCFRLTNWDATAFYSMVHTGMTIKIVNPDKDADSHE